MPATPLKATWSKISEHESLKRSSHAVAAIGEDVYVFGGELVARQPKDGDVHTFSLSPQVNGPKTFSSSSESPVPRVGASIVALNNTLYAFGGRGGTSMSALSESGGLWSFKPETSAWELITPADPSAPQPEPRSYHCATTDGQDTIFIHAGCPASGRLRDFWAFDVKSRMWKKLPEAPGSERGGTSVCFAAGRVWRMGGFDGKVEIGGSLDSFDVQGGKWETFEFSPDGVNGPGSRSVAALLPVKVAGKLFLVTAFGEADPSSLGHAGAGKMLKDVWAFDVEGKDWRKVDADTGKDGEPLPRGWFGAVVVGESKVVVVGGLGEDNDRLGDAWCLEFQ